jgi:hypothetical protein
MNMETTCLKRSSSDLMLGHASLTQVGGARNAPAGHIVGRALSARRLSWGSALQGKEKGVDRFITCFQW